MKCAFQRIPPNSLIDCVSMREPENDIEQNRQQKRWNCFTAIDPLLSRYELAMTCGWSIINVKMIVKNRYVYKNVTDNFF